MTVIGDFLKELRGDRSLREIQRLSGISHTYLSSIEKGVDPRSGNEILPTPDTLKKLAKAYNYSYRDLMDKSGYLEGMPERVKDRIAANYDTQIHLEGLLNETLKILTINDHFFDFIIADVNKIQDKYENHLEKGERITPDWLRDLVSEAEWDQEWIWDLVKEFIIIAKKHDLDYEEIVRKRHIEESEKKDLTVFLQKPGITYNGQPLNDDDRKRILTMLGTLFSDRKE